MRAHILDFTFVASFATALMLTASCDRPRAANSTLGTEAVALDSTTLAKEVTFSRGSGGSIVTVLSYGIRLNKESSLSREWVTAHDTRVPADIDGTAGISTIYVPGSGYSSGEYQYRGTFKLTPRDSLTAIEVRFILFDIWGEFVKTLQTTLIADMPAGVPREFDSRWNLYGDHEASEYYASIAYVARIRTRTGRVFEADYDPIVFEARKINTRFAPEDLDPLRRSARDSLRGVTR